MEINRNSLDHFDCLCFKGIRKNRGREGTKKYKENTRKKRPKSHKNTSAWNSNGILKSGRLRKKNGNQETQQERELKSKEKEIWKILVNIWLF